jgi:signal transduction histidine kinase
MSLAAPDAGVCVRALAALQRLPAELPLEELLARLATILREATGGDGAAVWIGDAADGDALAADGLDPAAARVTARLPDGEHAGVRALSAGGRHIGGALLAPANAPGDACSLGVLLDGAALLLARAHEAGARRRDGETVRLLARLASVAASRIDPGGLASSALDVAVPALDAHGGAVYLVEGDELVLAARIGQPGDPVAMVARLPIAGTLNARLLALTGAHQWTIAEIPDVPRRFLEAAGQRVVATAPLPAGGASIGLLHIARRDDRPFDTDELRLIGSIAAQIGPGLSAAVRLARNDAELDRRAAELSVLHRVASALGRTLDLRRVLDTCLDLAGELIGADTSAILLVDESTDEFQMVAQRDMLPDLIATTARLPREYVERARARPPGPYFVEMATYPEPLRSRVLAGGIVLSLNVPLFVENRLIGLHSFNFYKHRSLSARTLSTLSAIAEQEATAIDRARVHQQAELRAQLSDVVRGVAERSLTVASGEQLFDAVLDGAVRIGRSPSVRLGLLDDRGTLTVVGLRGAPLRELPNQRVAWDDPYLPWLLAMDGPTLITSVDDIPAGSVFQRAYTAGGLRSAVVIPLRLRGRLIGSLWSSSTEPRQFHPAEMNAMSLLASVAAATFEADELRRAADKERGRLGAIIDRLPMPVAVVDKRGRYEQVNAAFRTFNERARRGEFWSDSIRPLEISHPDGTRVSAEELVLNRALAADEPPPLEVRAKTPAGWRRVIAHTASLRDEHESVDAVVLALLDVTALRDLADAKDRFLDIASHELRAPLAALRACASLLEMDPTAVTVEERRRNLLHRITYQVDRLAALVNELVDMAQLRGGTLQLACAPMDLTETARETIEVTQLQAPNHQLRLEARGAVEGAWDRARLAQVMTNLVSNAIRYSPDGGEIVIAVRTEGDTAVLSVRDAGIGIPAATQRHLFEPYYRGREAGELARSGLGLGLYITLEIVRRHGGRIEVESELGRGSRFTVVLPLDSSPLQPKPRP